MSYVTSASTDAQVRAAYADNASYDVAGDVAMAKSFIVACRVLLQREPTSAGRNGNAVVLDKTSVRESLAKAESWLASHAPVPVSGGNGSVRFMDFGGFRS